MSKISKILQCSDCESKLNEICDTLEYNECEREIVAEVLLYLEMQKLKEKSVKKKSIQDVVAGDLVKLQNDHTINAPMWDNEPYHWHTVKC